MENATSSTSRDPEFAFRFRYWLGRYIAGGVIAFLAITGGIYAGFSLAMRNASGAQPLALLNNSYLEVGDQLPDYRLYDPRSGQDVQLEQLVEQKPAILLFVSGSCDACVRMADYWKGKVLPQLSPRFVILEIYDEDERNSDSTSAAIQGLFPGSVQVFTDRDQYGHVDGINATPTLVAVNGEQRVTLVCTGFHRSVGAELILKSATS